MAFPWKRGIGSPLGVPVPWCKLYSSSINSPCENRRGRGAKEDRLGGRVGLERLKWEGGLGDGQVAGGGDRKEDRVVRWGGVEDGVGGSLPWGWGTYPTRI